MNQKGLSQLPEVLEQLYRSYGYAAYTMSKFEEYGLYLRNKDFLISDRVLTFTDTDGKLMALKPDVTLSIIKNTRSREEGIQKLFYRENVYRPGRSMDGFREIMQIGLECMGQVDDYCVSEVLTLAVKSLRAISDSCVLDVSHMGLISGLLDRLGMEGTVRAQALEAIGSKNRPALSQLCREQQLPETELLQLSELCGVPSRVLPRLKELFLESRELSQLEQVLQALAEQGCDNCVRLDFSVVNDRKYYNGIVFRGFVEGVPEGVLSGGEYDGLMARMHRQEKAIGFALYPDLLERLEEPVKQPVPDVVLLYPADAGAAAVTAAACQLRSEGRTVCVLPDTGKDCPGGAVYVLEGNEVKRRG